MDYVAVASYMSDMEIIDKRLQDLEHKLDAILKALHNILKEIKK